MGESNGQKCRDQEIADGKIGSLGGEDSAGQTEVVCQGRPDNGQKGDRYKRFQEMFPANDEKERQHKVKLFFDGERPEVHCVAVVGGDRKVESIPPVAVGKR